MLAGLLVSTSHQIECGGAMATAAHVSMDSNACLGSGKCTSASWCAPSASRLAHSIQLEVLAVSDQRRDAKTQPLSLRLP